MSNWPGRTKVGWLHKKKEGKKKEKKDKQDGLTINGRHILK